MQDQIKSAVKLYQEVTGATQKQVATLADIDQIYLNKILQGKYPASEKIVSKLIAGGIINPEKYPELVTDIVKQELAMAALRNTKVDLSAMASSIQALVSKGIRPEKIPAFIRAIPL